MTPVSPSFIKGGARFGRPSGARGGGSAGSGGSARSSLHRPATFRRPSGARIAWAVQLLWIVVVRVPLRGKNCVGGSAVMDRCRCRNRCRNRILSLAMSEFFSANGASASGARFGHPSGARGGGSVGSGGSARSSLHRPATFGHPSGARIGRGKDGLSVVGKGLKGSSVEFKYFFISSAPGSNS